MQFIRARNAMARGFVEIDALIAMAILILTLYVFLFAAIFSVQELKEKTQTFEQVHEAVVNCKYYFENGELKRCKNDFIN